MAKPRQDAKEQLLQGALDIIAEGADPEKITTRTIAERAGLNIALINYYFQSKDNLIEQAVGIKMAEFAKEMYHAGNLPRDPVERLKIMLKKNTALGLRYDTILKKSIAFELKNGSYNTMQFILPILKEIFQNQKTERELQLIALQLLVPLQTMSIYPEVYQKNLKIDMRDSNGIHHIIDTFIDNLLPKDYHERRSLSEDI